MWEGVVFWCREKQKTFLEILKKVLDNFRGVWYYIQVVR